MTSPNLTSAHSFGIVRTAQRFFDVLGFQLVDQRLRWKNIKDSEFYKPTFSPWLTAEWRKRLRADDPRSLLGAHAKYLLCCLAQDATRRCPGDVAECGVYKGGTAKILAELVCDRPVHLFDTFSGMPETDPGKDIHQAGDFNDTSLEVVQAYLSDHANVNCIAGLIPASLETVSCRTFSFVHVDLDIYASIKAACEFFYCRLQAGGTLLFDDYGYASCPGARSAIEEFFSDKPETLIAHITGQCSVQKI